MSNRLVIGLKSGTVKVRPFTPAQEAEKARRQNEFETVECKRIAQARTREEGEARCAAICKPDEFVALLADYTVLVNKGRANWTAEEATRAGAFESKQLQMSRIRERSAALQASIGSMSYRATMDFNAQDDVHWVRP